MVQLVFMAGFGNSEPQHWQSLWREENPGSLWVEPPSWCVPVRDEWVKALDATLAKHEGPKLIIAHSMGCLTVAEASPLLRDRGVIGAFLVAPPAVDGPQFPVAARGFHCALCLELNVPALVVASTNDPYCPAEQAARIAKQWRAGYVSVGERGHINLASRLGDWPEGKALFQKFAASLLERDSQ